MARKPTHPATQNSVANRVTMREVAEEAGVHFTTISLALRNHPRIPVATRKRIQKIAKKMGYRPDPMVTALNAYRTSRQPTRYQATIAWINNWPVKAQMLSIPEFQEYHSGARSRTEELGYVLEEFWMHQPGMTAKSMNRILRARNISAVLVAPQPVAAAPLGLEYKDLSAVAFGYSLQPAVLHVVTSHHFHSMNLVMERLVEQGYRRPGLIYPAEWDEKAENCCQGGLALAQTKWTQLGRVRPILQTAPSDTELKRWIAEEKPDVVVSYNPIADRLRKLGYRLPEDLGFVSLDLKREEKVLSGVYQNDLLIGRTAVDLVVAMLHRGEKGEPAVPVRTLVESAWRPGKTLRPRKKG